MWKFDWFLQHPEFPLKRPNARPVDPFSYKKQAAKLMECKTDSWFLDGFISNVYGLEWLEKCFWHFDLEQLEHFRVISFMVKAVCSVFLWIFHHPEFACCALHIQTFFVHLFSALSFRLHFQIHSVFPIVRQMLKGSSQRGDNISKGHKFTSNKETQSEGHKQPGSLKKTSIAKKKPHENTEKKVFNFS